MLKKLKQFLSLLNPFKKNETNKVRLPKDICGSEKIVRVLFFPEHVTKDLKSIRAIAYRTSSKKDGVSVIRQDYCTPSFCKQHGKRIQSPVNKKAYFGLGLLTAEKIRKAGANVEYTPEEHVFHADIKIGYTPVKGVELPSRYKLIVEAMADAAKMYIDPSPDSNEWEGDDLIY